MVSPQFPPPYRRRWSRGQKLAFAIPVLLAALFIVLCSAGALMQTFTTPSRGHSSAPIHLAVTMTPDPGVRPTVDPLSAADVQLTIKITRKHCFGSAGCNVTYNVQAGWPADAVVTDSCAVTYAVNGVEDGPQVNTLTIESDGTFEHDSEENASTSKPSAKLTVKVQEVDCNG